MTIEYKQPTKEQFTNIMDSFWIMLRECENMADSNNGAVMKHWVEGFYKQWNSVQVNNNKNLKPRWKDQSCNSQF